MIQGKKEDAPQLRSRRASRWLLLGLPFLLMAGAANAAAVHWQLNGVTFADGGHAFGGFDYDPVANTYANINITTTPGSVLQGSFFNTPAPYPNSTAANYANFVSTTPVFSGTTLALALTFASPLTAAGGTVSIVSFASESTCANSICGSVTPQRAITAGTVNADSTSAQKHWWITGVTLSDGAVVFGGFNYDANLGTFSGISVTSTGGAAAAGASYFTKNAGSATVVTLVSASTIVAGTTTVITLTLSSGMTNAGGSIPIASVSEGTCLSANCSSVNSVRTSIAAGTLTSTGPTDYSKVLPQWADGGGFTTVFIFTNPTGAAITCRITFWGDDGSLKKLSLNGATAASGYTIVVPPHGTQFLSTPGTGANTEGWALAENVSAIGVVAAYRLVLNPLPESEATVSGIDATAGFAMAFDETTGFDTGFALANVSSTDTVIENLYFYDTNGNFLYSDSSHTLAPHTHEAFMLSNRYSAQLAGKQGTVRLYYGVQGNPAAGTTGITGMGLRTNPGGTFTSLPTFTAAQETSTN